jgi:hypothetical protein
MIECRVIKYLTGPPSSSLTFLGKIGARNINLLQGISSVLAGQFLQPPPELKGASFAHAYFRVLHVKNPKTCITYRWFI